MPLIAFQLSLTYNDTDDPSKTKTVHFPCWRITSHIDNDTTVLEFWEVGQHEYSTPKLVVKTMDILGIDLR